MGSCIGSQDLLGLEAEMVDDTANINPLGGDAASSIVLLACLVVVLAFLQSQGGNFAGSH